MFVTLQAGLHAEARFTYCRRVFMRVGFENRYDPGLYCWEYVGYIYRGRLEFPTPDPHMMGEVQKAALSLENTYTEKSFGEYASNGGSCAASMYVQDSPGGDSFNVSSHLYVHLPMDGTPIAQGVEYDGRNLRIDITDIEGAVWLHRQCSIAAIFQLPRVHDLGL